MEIKDLKALEELVKLCRKVGIDAFELGPMKFNLGAEPKAKPRRRPTLVSNDFPEASIKVPQYNPLIKPMSDAMIITDNSIKTDELTPEQLLFYSSNSEAQGD